MTCKLPDPPTEDRQKFKCEKCGTTWVSRWFDAKPVDGYFTHFYYWGRSVFSVGKRCR